VDARAAGLDEDAATAVAHHALRIIARGECPDGTYADVGS
jgi:hypothetical protein